MTILEARNICRNYYDLTNPSEEDRFLLAVCTMSSAALILP